MLELKNLVKIYQSGGESHTALDHINLTFGDQEFVSILGASGSGKTTLLNVIGGLDSYDQGDLVVDGTSTQNFTDRDWDSYRNGTIGFVFQSYNLISHLSILENVQMALSISGVSSKESQARARQALVEVGLEQHVDKKPSQLSGGQMQRVAIARALVTNPKIILADEPTGALDSKTSVQIMELIKKISRDKLVIMVTHNPELAEQYSDRIIRVADGEIVEDTAPYHEKADEQAAGYEAPKTAMSFGQAVSSSFKNLLTKKTRTILTTFAASIGIISVGTVLAISSGMSGYIQTTQEDTLSTMPITISAVDSGQGVAALSDRLSEENTGKLTEISLAKQSQTHQNRYTAEALNKGETFISYMEENAADYYKSLSFNTGYQFKALVKDSKGQIQQIEENQVRTLIATNTNFAVLPADSTTITDKYKLVASKDQKFTYPTANQAILFVNADGSLTADQLKMLGYDGAEKVAVSDVIGKEIRVVDNDNYFRQVGDNFIPNTINQDLYDKGEKLEITAVMQLKDNTTTMFNGTIGYSQEFLNSILAKEKNSALVKAQKASPSKSLLGISQESLTEDSLQATLQQLGGDDTPTSLSFYAKSFDDRERILQVMDDYNQAVAKKYGKNSSDFDKYSISYTDVAKTLTSAFNDIIGSVTFILTAFSGISLLVSSVMIGILTYVSVVERTKEIGILRAIGARKKDISRIFNAEAGLLGLTSGLLGVGIAALLTLPINSLVAS